MNLKRYYLDKMDKMDKMDWVDRMDKELHALNSEIRYTLHGHSNMLVSKMRITASRIF
ncbi:MAG: hypothetical protein GY757_12445 [bacterium]|nr:hypothetical protein [bacterium]